MAKLTTAYIPPDANAMQYPTTNITLTLCISGDFKHEYFKPRFRNSTSKANTLDKI